MYKFALPLSVAAILASAAPATAQATNPAANSAAAPAQSILTLDPMLAPDSIDDKLADGAARPGGILSNGPVSLIDPAWKKLNKSFGSIGLKLGLTYTAVFQAASNGPGTRTAAGQDFDFFGEWRLLGGKDSTNPGFLYFASEWRGDMGTGIAPAGLGSQIGSLWGTTNGFGEQPVTLKEIYWEQRFNKDAVIIRVGKLDPENYYNSNYWQSDSRYFLNAAFSSFPVRSFPGQGLGLNLTAKLNNLWAFSAGVQDAQGKKTLAGFNTFFGDFNMFSAAEIRFTPTIPQLGQGNYRLAAWYRDAGESNSKPHDAGIDLSIDQRVGAHLIPFFRYGAGEGNINGIEQMVSMGVGWEGKLLTRSDVVGIGTAWGRPSNHDLRDQFSAELFYRLQVSPDNQFTVGYQVIFDPADDPGSDVVGVLELRWRITF